MAIFKQQQWQQALFAWLQQSITVLQKLLEFNYWFLFKLNIQRNNLNISIITYFQPSVGLIIPETSLSLNLKQDDINEI